MALEQALELNGTGIIVRYWRIARVTMMFPSYAADGGPIVPDVEVILHGFLSKEARDAGRLVIFSETVKLDQANTGDALDPMRSLAYAAVKASERFAGAKDI